MLYEIKIRDVCAKNITVDNHFVQKYNLTTFGGVEIICSKSHCC